MKPEELALLRRYGQRKRHEATSLRKADREAEMQRLYVLDEIHKAAMDRIDEPFYARAIAEQRRYEDMERLGKTLREVAQTISRRMTPALLKAGRAVAELNRALEEAKAR